MSGYKLQKVKKYLENNFAKGFITFSQAFFTFFILFIQKSKSDFRFCINYRKLNKIIKRNKYFLPLINKILARI